MREGGERDKQTPIETINTKQGPSSCCPEIGASIPQFKYWARLSALWNVPLATVSCPGHASSQLLLHLLPGKPKIPRFGGSTTEQPLQHQFGITSILLQNPNHGTAPATENKTNPAPAENHF